MLKRLFDILFAFGGILIISPLLFIIAIAIVIDSKGGVFYVSDRVGRYEKVFKFIKFRTMKPNSDKTSITIGKNDCRITKVGKYLRKTKLDELPQLFNVLIGQLSMVGPRPDVPKYIQTYKQNFSEYYIFKPGITSYSSIYFENECELYIGLTDAEKLYMEYTIPKKIELDKKYFQNKSIFAYFSLIFKTIFIIFKKN
jgi:lipopolysaccharide/colanic/teichoic acid biosynthesis glycosyltransferase